LKKPPTMVITVVATASPIAPRTSRKTMKARIARGTSKIFINSIFAH
jgi:hypothetical protein